MKANDFITDWNRTHTSSPSFQDVLDWADQKQSEEMQGIIKWLEKNLPDVEYITNASPYRQSKSEFIETFRKTVEK